MQTVPPVKSCPSAAHAVCVVSSHRLHLYVSCPASVQVAVVDTNTVKSCPPSQGSLVPLFGSLQAVNVNIKAIMKMRLQCDNG